MPRVPTAQDSGIGNAQANSTNLRQNLSINPGQFGGEKAKEIIAIGEALGGVSNVVNDTALKIKQEDDNQASLNAYTKASDEKREFLNAPDTGLYSQRGSNAIGAVKTATKTMDEIYEKYSEALQNDEQKEQFTSLWGRTRETALNGAARHEAKERQTYKEETTAAIVSDAINDSYQNYTDVNVVNESLERGESVIRINGSGKPPEVIAAKVLEFKSSVRRSVVERLMEDHLPTAKKYFKDHQKDITPDVQKAIKSSFDKYENKINKNAEASIKAITSRMSEGLEIPEAELHQVGKSMHSSTDKDLIKKWNAVVQAQSFQKEAKKLTPTQLEGLINSELIPAVKNDGATEGEFTRLNMANKLLNKMSTELKSDPINWASQSGQFDIGVIDINNPNTLTERTARALEVANTYGTEPAFFSNEEAAEITEGLERAPAQQQLEFAKAIQFSAGELAPYALAQVAKKNKTLGYAAGLSLKSPEHRDIALSVLKGKAALKDNPNLVVSKAEANVIFNKVMENSLQNLPNQAAAIRQSADARYIDLAQSEGEDLSTVNSDLYERALREVLGGRDDNDTGVAKINGQKFILPANVDENTFERFTKNLDDPILVGFSQTKTAPIYSTGKKATPKQIASDGQFLSVGDSKYLIKMRSDDNFLQADKTGGYYVLDLSTDIVEKISKREAK